jgi:propionyl-CoA carboxylase alpha chain
MGAQAVALSKAVGYHSAGTVEFIVDGDRNFYFLEMNTRLQVEHPVTELVTGIDLVEEMIRVAAGEKLRLSQDDVSLKGWAVESRLYAEDPYRNFLPSIGRLSRYRPPREGNRDDGTLIRNDTGVFEGGEISMYYDPMIAKLCAWAPDRLAAIDAMSAALDDFELDGIGHNLPFLSAVMRHERFRKGEITTAFIAEEWPEGFSGVTPGGDEARALAAVAAFVHFRSQKRSVLISGALDNHRRTVGREWVVKVNGTEFEVSLREEGGATMVASGDGKPVPVTSDWLPGRPHARFIVGGEAMGVKVQPVNSGWRLRWRGMDLKIHVRSPRVAELARLMPEKAPPDTSKMLLCPMPGVVTSIMVQVGAEVQEGQPLATVEAMKMENVLRAERRAIVKAIPVEAGASLAVDEMIMEFE